MKFTKKITSMFRKVPKALAVTFASLAVLAGASAMVRAEFFPIRPVYDYNKAPLNGTTCTLEDDAAKNKCGSMTGPVFNSFVNTPSYGDERTFLDASRTDQTAAGSYKNILENVDQGSKEVVLRTYIHNNGNQNLNASGVSVAKNAKVRVELPTAEAQVLRAHSYISADNASLVEDTVDLTSTQKFTVEYIPGSATLYNYGPFQNGTPLSDSVVTTGAPIGYDSMNGTLPGCFDYAATVQIRVRIIVKTTPQLNFTKQVRKAGETAWKKEVNAKPGEKVEWLLTTKTISDNNNIVVRDVAAPNTTLNTGSVRYINGGGNTAQNDKPLFDGGINAGNYGTGSGFYILYGSTVKGDFAGCEARVRNLAYVRSDQVKEIGDDADVIITKENCNTVTHPGVSIDKKVDGVEKKTVNVNQEFDYQLVVRNTGDVALTNVVVSDNAPANVQFISTDKGSVSGNKLTYTIPALAVGAAQTINIKAKVVAEVAGDIINTACVNAPEVNPNNPNDNDDCDDATVNVPTPIYSCDLLSGTKIGDHKYKFDVRYTAKDGATLKNFKYVYGDGSSVNTTATSTEHTYSNDGTFNIAVAATFAVNGTDKTVTSENCATSVTISPKPVTPVYSCDMFTAEKLGVKSYRYTVKFTAHDGATLKYISYDFGDGSDKLMTDKTVVEHTYEKEGTYVPRAVIYFMVNGEEKKVESDKCSAAVTISTPKFCTVPGKETLPVDSPECMTPVTPITPTSGTLTDTGAGNIFGLFSVVTLAGAFMHRAFADRKSA